MSALSMLYSQHRGCESLSFTERVSLTLKDMNLKLTEFNSKHFNDSLHPVPFGNIFKHLKTKNDYLTLSVDFIAAPLFFDPKKMSFREYVKICIMTPGLFNVANDELGMIYKALKNVTVTNNVPFKLRTSQYRELLDDVSIKLDNVFENTGQGTRLLTDMYSSFTDASEIFSLYNDNIKNITARDPEVLVKKVQQLTDLVKIIYKKIDIADIILEKDDLETFEIMLKQVDKLIQQCGRLLSMCNELTRVFEIQRDYFKQKQ